jgi:fatty-acyl-CoA synthase
MTTVGRPMAAVEIAIRAPESKNRLLQGKPGEVCFRGWCAMQGYFDDPERTAEALDDEGWLRTGDLGVIDEDGYLALIRRIKEMIRVGGENVAAADVESVLLKYERVKQAIAVGAADDRLGEVVAAFIELKTGVQATDAEIIEQSRRHLASFKVPRRVVFVREWPMSGTGKIQRFVLRQSLASKENG